MTDALFQSVGAHVFDLIKLLESLIVGVVNVHGPHTSVDEKFICKMEAEAVHLVTQWGLNGMEIIYTITSLLNNKDVRGVAEKMTLFRLWGHPPVEAAASIEKLRGYLTVPSILSYQSLLINNAMLKLTIINGYAKKHDGCWPLMEYSQTLCPVSGETCSVQLAGVPPSQI